MRTLIFLIFGFINASYGSMGDMTPYHLRCLDKCRLKNCTSNESLQRYSSSQSWPEYALGWTCYEALCKYPCMWSTVDYFRLTLKRPVPQFYGKWPFIKVFGIQEPAAFLASVLNLIPHLYLISQFRSQIHPKTPMYLIWSVYALVSVNTWACSAIFHAHDTDLTEKMDYLSAFSIVMYSLIAFFFKFFQQDRQSKTLWALIVLCLAFFFNHVYYMGVVHFDYGYNMKANIAVGAVNSLCWFGWAFKYWNSQPQVRHGALAVLCLNLSILLEVLDFPPVLWILDSHALWHFSTAPIHFIWYKFIIQDSHMTMKELKIGV